MAPLALLLEFAVNIKAPVEDGTQANMSVQVYLDHILLVALGQNMNQNAVFSSSHTHGGWRGQPQALYVHTVKLS